MSESFPNGSRLRAAVRPFGNFLIGMIAVSGALAGFAISLPAAAVPTYTSFDPPDSVQTLASGINDDGTIVGTYSKSDNEVRGFVRTSDGSIATFNDPNDHGFTAAGAISSDGSVTGNYSDSRGNAHGYLRTSDGTFYDFDPRDSVYTLPTSINDKDVVGGYYENAGGTQYPFVRSQRGKVNEINLAGADVESINDKGTITGNAGHGYERFSNGAVVYFDPPKSQYTRPASINAKGVITGDYTKDFSRYHGFVRAADGTMTSFDPNGSVDTSPHAINVKSIIAGLYSTKNEHGAHGFERKSNGIIVSFDFPGSAHTYPMSINRAGVIAGFYTDSSGVYHGFLRTP